jgi:hypothetical protein
VALAAFDTLVRIEAAMRVLPKPIGFRKAGVVGRCKFGGPITPVIGIDIDGDQAVSF